MLIVLVLVLLALVLFGYAGRPGSARPIPGIIFEGLRIAAVILVVLIVLDLAGVVDF